jgi:hypothetical protein
MTLGPDEESGDETGTGATRESPTHAAENDESRRSPRDSDSPRTERTSPGDAAGERDEYRTPAVEESEREGEWKFPLDALSDDGEDGEGNITGTLDRNQSLEPGDIDPENAFFVAVGILIVVGLIAGAMFGF